MRKITGNPYEEICNIIEEWCHGESEDGNGRWEDFLVTVQLGSSPPETHYLELEITDDVGFVWSTDWWEGEKDVRLVGFMPLSRVEFSTDPDGRVIE